MQDSEARTAVLLYATMASALLLGFGSLDAVLGINLPNILGFETATILPSLSLLALGFLVIWELYNPLRWKTEVLAIYELAIERKRKDEILAFNPITELLTRGAWLEVENWLKYELLPRPLWPVLNFSLESAPGTYRVAFSTDDLQKLKILPKDEGLIGGDPALVKVEVLGNQIVIKANMEKWSKEDKEKAQ